MGFTKKTWKNRIAEYINRRLITMEDGSTNLVTVARDEGTISQEGDAFNAVNMNDLEDRIEAGFDEVNQSLTNINTYVGEDGKLHFVDSTGADTVLPFSNLKYFIKNGILQDGVVATPPKVYTTNNNCTTQNGYFLTYVGTSNTGYYCQINGIDLTDIDILIIAATCPSSGQNYWTLFDSASKVISTGKWTYVDVRTKSGIAFLRTFYGSLNIYNMFGMKYPV